MRLRIDKLNRQIAELERERDVCVRDYASARAEQLNPEHRRQIAAAADQGD